MADEPAAPTTAPATTPAVEPTPPTPTPDPPSLLNEGPKEPEAPKGPAVSEVYSDFILPEGFEANPEVMTKAASLFKELGLPQEGAQRLVDFYSAQAKEIAEAPFNAWRDIQKGWRGEIENDPQIGGQNLDGTRSTIAKAIGLLPQELQSQYREAMDFTGAGNNPAFVRATHAWAKLLTEAGIIKADKAPAPPGQAKPGTMAAAMYPNLPAAG